MSPKIPAKAKRTMIAMGPRTQVLAHRKVVKGSLGNCLAPINTKRRSQAIKKKRKDKTKFQKKAIPSVQSSTRQQSDRGPESERKKSKRRI